MNLQSSGTIARIAAQISCYVALAALILWGRPIYAAPATFVTALPVAQDQLLLRFNAQPRLGSKGYKSFQFPVNIGYGVSPNWALFINVNQGFTSLQSSTSSTSTLTNGGWGDSLLFMRNTLFKLDRPRSTFRIAPLAGLYLPTGSNHVTIAGQLEPAPLQPGSGTFDPYAGITVGYNGLRFGAAGDVTYRLNPLTTVGYSPGSRFKSDGQVEARLLPVHLPEEGLPELLILSVESNYEQDAGSHTSGAYNTQSSSKSFKQDAILELATLHWELGAGVQIPLLQDFASPAATREHGGGYVFFEYYLATPSWRHRSTRR